EASVRWELRELRAGGGKGKAGQQPNKEMTDWVSTWQSVTPRQRAIPGRRGGSGVKAEGRLTAWTVWGLFASQRGRQTQNGTCRPSRPWVYATCRWPFNFAGGTTTPTPKMADTFDLPPPLYQYRRITKKLPTTNDIPLDAPIGPFAYYVITRGAEIGLFNSLKIVLRSTKCGSGNTFQGFLSWGEAFTVWVRFLDDTFGEDVEPGLWVCAFCPETRTLAWQRAEERATCERLRRWNIEQQEQGDGDAAELLNAACPAYDEKAPDKDEDQDADEDADEDVEGDVGGEGFPLTYIVQVGAKPGVYATREEALSAMGVAGDLRAFEISDEAYCYFATHYMQGDVVPMRRFL
ncbi:hypothetical protein BD410DRAFT_810203, partial [Rickenella mellea]